MTNRELQRLGLKWIERLRLQGWDVRFKFVSKEEAKGFWGQCQPDTHAKTAVISIADTRDPDWKNQEHPRDVETILVHEICHLMLAPFEFKIGSPKQIIEENFVNTVARLLIALDRSDESVMNGGRPLSRRAKIRKPVTRKKNKP
jgi:hypothetical protein